MKNNLIRMIYIIKTDDVWGIERIDQSLIKTFKVWLGPFGRTLFPKLVSFCLRPVVNAWWEPKLFHNIRLFSLFSASREINRASSNQPKIKGELKRSRRRKINDISKLNIKVIISKLKLLIYVYNKVQKQPESWVVNESFDPLTSAACKIKLM